MNLKAARVSTGDVFEQSTIPFENIPKQSPLFLDFLKDKVCCDSFYPAKKTPIKEFSEKVLNNYRINRNELCDALTEINRSLGAGEKTLENIKLLVDRNCGAIVTGQQAGLFSGAAYTIYKALSAVKLAEELRAQNIKAVPVFWIAEEDHDFDEVKSTHVLNKKGKLYKAENTPHELTPHSPVGLVKLDNTIEKTLGDLFDNLPYTEFTGEIKQLLSQAYQSGETFSTAFAKLVSKLFAAYGLIIVTPMNVRLKKLCAPIFVEAIEKAEQIVAGLLDRNEKLPKENYPLQVLVEKDSFPLFFQNENGERQSLRRNLENGKVKVYKSKTEFETAELIETARSAPQNLSPNALMRSVVQDYLFPTFTYFGGAAEIAYFAQNSVIYEVLNRPVTPIRHRASITIVEPKNERTFRKYELNLADLFEGKDAVQSKIVEKFLNRETAQVFAAVERNIEAELNLLSVNLEASEPTLAANLENRKKKILWHLGALRNKYHRAELIKNETVENRLENLFTALLPHHALQERTLNAVTFLNLYGTNFIEWVYSTIDTDERRHQILHL